LHAPGRRGVAGADPIERALALVREQLRVSVSFVSGIVDGREVVFHMAGGGGLASFVAGAARRSVTRSASGCSPDASATSCRTWRPSLALADLIWPARMRSVGVVDAIAGAILGSSGGSDHATSGTSRRGQAQCRCSARARDRDSSPTIPASCPGHVEGLAWSELALGAVGRQQRTTERCNAEAVGPATTDRDAWPGIGVP
jgi:hypothetical protein